MNLFKYVFLICAFTVFVFAFNVGAKTEPRAETKAIIKTKILAAVNLGGGRKFKVLLSPPGTLSYELSDAKGKSLKTDNIGGVTAKADQTSVELKLAGAHVKSNTQFVHAMISPTEPDQEISQWTERIFAVKKDGSVIIEGPSFTTQGEHEGGYNFEFDYSQLASKGEIKSVVFLDDDFFRKHPKVKHGPKEPLDVYYPAVFRTDTWNGVDWDSKEIFNYLDNPGE